MASTRRIYSREELLSYREISASIHFPIARIPVRVPRRNHKKSTSNDNEGSKSHTKQVVGSSQEDLASEEVDPSSTSAASWHRVNRYQWTTGGNASHLGGLSYQSRPRFPSGSHGDDETATSNLATTTTAPLRPVPDTRRGGQGDWSRGCAGWRQRSYSGSERSFAVPSNTNNHTNNSGYSRGIGRGGGNNDDPTASLGFTSRGRGRARGRYNNSNSSIHFQQPRSAASATFSKPHGAGGRPMSCVGSIPTADATTTITHLSGAGESHEEFWQDEDWENMEREDKQHTKPQQIHPAEPTIDTLGARAPDAPSVDVIEKAVSGMRIHSKSCSVDPPPGFTPPNTIAPSITGNQAPTEQPSSTFVPREQVPTAMPQCNSPVATSWFYIDLAGHTQGPFSNHQMAGWMANGLLPLAIDIRRGCDECFISLVDHMHLAGRVPFWDGYMKPPITRAMVASLPTPNGSRWPDFSADVSQSSVPLPAVGITGCMNLLTSPMTNEAIPRIATYDDVTGLQPTKPLSPNGMSQLQQNATASTTLPLNQPNIDRVDILRLYTEAQQLVANAAKVEVERQQLVDKIAAINSTAAAMILASAPSCPISQNQPTLPQKTGPMDTVIAGGGDVSDPTVDSMPKDKREVKSQPVHAWSRSVDHSSPKGLSPVPVESVQPSSVADPIPEEKADDHADDDEEDLDGGDESFQSQELKVEADSTNTTITGSVPGEAGRKLKKKKKSKKTKPNADQERLSAWEAEFERRKAVARERQLAEEAELVALAAEEAAALAEEQARLASEQARVLNEQRRREAQRVKAGQQLSHLQLPTSAKWGGAGGDVNITASSAVSVSNSFSSGPSVVAGNSNRSLLAIQAAQASEEAERKRRESILAEQEAVALTAAAASALKQRPTAWSAVVQPETKPSVNVGNSTSAVRQPHQNVNSKSNRVAVNITPAKLSPGTVDSSSVKAERSKTTATTGGTHGKSVNVNAAAKSISSPTATTSIWDLPVGGAAAAGNKNAKKHNKKKNTQCSREAACFAAKEELAHWCETQLSSLPLPSVDLPTLVDLLCELEATDQVVEFIESSLGRSKQISKFSKAFLEKRAFVLKAMS